MQWKLYFINMQVISTREFRANQKKYFDLAAHETIYVARRNAQPILISVAKRRGYAYKGRTSVYPKRLRRFEEWSY